MYTLVFFVMILLSLYYYCYSSIWFVIKFIICFCRNILWIVLEGYADVKAWIKGDCRFKDYGYYVYGGSYGAGKTLNMVKHAWRLIEYYQKFYKVTVISNMHLNGIDYLPFEYFEDLEYEPEKGEVVIYVIDEGGSIFYSRNCTKSRLNEEDIVLALNQVRKDNKCILISSQRHKQLDVALRRVCNVWYEVNKRWRFSFIECYDGYDLEYGDPAALRPIRRRVEYARDEDRICYRHKEKIVMLNKERLSFSDSAININLSLQERKKSRKKAKVI